jgi:hypothetical protein
MRRHLVLLCGVALVAVLAAACAPRPFNDASPWNTPIPASAGWRDVPSLRSGNSWVADEAFSTPVVHSNAADPIVAVQVPATLGWPAGVVHLHIPAWVTGAAGTDGALVVVSDGIAFNFWQFRRLDVGSATTSAYAASFLSGSGFGRPSPVLGAGIRADGSSGLGGLITRGDLVGNEIPHALAVSLLGSELAGGFVAPAIAADSSGGGGGTIPLGSRLGIPRGTPVPAGLSPIGTKVWNTLVDYGAFVVDRHEGTAPVIFEADPLSVSPAQVDPLRAGSPSDLDRIMPFVRVVQ